MASNLEIERKFLVISDDWYREDLAASVYRQGYLRADDQATVRVRAAGDQAWLTIKGMRQGIARAEFEYEIPSADAQQLLRGCCGDCVEKTRYLVPHHGHTWEVDVFSGANQGLVMAEVELQSVDEVVALPDWVGQEVSEDLRYTNSSLSLRPFATWTP